MISNETIQKVNETIDIKEIVESYVSLKQKGNSKYLWACCPFHEEKTPSFSITPERGFYKCFGCGKSGDSINFIMEHDGLTYAETIRHLAKKYGIEIIENESTDSQKEDQNEKESLHIVLNYAKDYFINQLHNTEEGKTIGLTYFKERSFQKDIIEKFELGYSPNKWNNLIQDAEKKSYNLDLLLKAGLISKNNEKSFDKFRGRIIFPIHNIIGKVIGFGARTLTKESSPKYLNSPESDVYSKSKILYGLYQAKNEIRNQDNCYLVEGYTDVISLHQSKIHNVVSSSGTSLTIDQIKLINRFTQNITILFDGDKAGIKASLRGIDMILEQGMNVKIITFPDGEDPDSYCKRIGQNAFVQHLIENTMDFISFKAELYAQDTQEDTFKKADSIKEVIGSIAKIPDGIKRSLYVKQCSEKFDMEESILIVELNKFLIKNQNNKINNVKTKTADGFLEDISPSKNKQELTTNYSDLVSIQERESIRLLISYGANKIEKDKHLCEYILQELEDVVFITPLYREIFSVFKSQLKEGNIIDADYLIKNTSQEIKEEIIDMISVNRNISPQWSEKHEIFIPTEKDVLSKVVYSNINRLKFRIIQKLISENLKKMKDEKDEKNKEKFFEIHNNLKIVEIEVGKKLGIVISN